MQKMKTLYKKDLNDLSRVTDELDPECLWAFDEGVKATRKFDGTACAIINGKLYKRWDNKKGKTPPEGSIECQEADEFTGHHPYWIPCLRSDNSNKFHFEAFDKRDVWEDGTYELIGERINKNMEHVGNGHILIKHGDISFKEKEKEWMLKSIDNLKSFLANSDIEGIVFHHPDGRMCKIRKKDFGMVR